MKTVYLIVSRYENDEFYGIYGASENKDDAIKAWKMSLKNFFANGPDDCIVLSLVKCELSDADFNELSNHMKKYDEDSEYMYDENFIEFMKNHIDMYNDAVYGPEDCTGAMEIFDTIENNSENADDPKVFTKYFNKYYKQHYV